MTTISATEAVGRDANAILTDHIRRQQDTIDALVDALEGIVAAKALSGVRELVAGWNGESRPEGPYKERHQRSLGATLPKTNCGAIYDLDEAMTNARAAISKAKAETRNEKEGE